VAWPFAKKKTFIDRYPDAAPVYNRLNDAQKKVLDDFSYLEKKHLKADQRVALERILSTYVVVNYPNLGRKEMERKTDALYDSCKLILKDAPLTTNISAKLFALDKFWESQEVKTVWTTASGKGQGYFNTRQAVEENVFGYKIDWKVPVREAAKTRPIYAGLNFVSHPYGAAAVYGSVNCVLKMAVKPRCTYINTDTFDASFRFAAGSPDDIEAAKKKICTNAHLESLIANISDRQLRSLCEKAEGKYILTNDPPNYIEAQVHGGVEWTKDLDEINIAKDTLAAEAKQANKSVDTLKYLVAEFARKFNVPCGIYVLDRMVEKLN
jgi:hypothetical protein